MNLSLDFVDVFNPLSRNMFESDHTASWQRASLSTFMGGVQQFKSSCKQAIKKQTNKKIRQQRDDSERARCTQTKHQNNGRRLAQNTNQRSNRVDCQKFGPKSQVTDTALLQTEKDLPTLYKPGF